MHIHAAFARHWAENWWRFSALLGAKLVSYLVVFDQPSVMSIDYDPLLRLLLQRLSPPLPASIRAHFQFLASHLGLHKFHLHAGFGRAKYSSSHMPWLHPRHGPSVHLLRGLGADIRVSQ